MRFSSKSLLGALIFALIVVFSGFGAGAQQAPPQAANDSYPRVFLDDLGNEVHLGKKPESIISVSIFSDEVLVGLLPLERFAAVTRIGLDPVYSNVAEELSGIQPVIDFSAEQIINIYPDLVIATDWNESDPLVLIRQAGIPVYQVATPSDLDGIRAAISDLGRVLDEEGAAEELLFHFDQRSEALQSFASSLAATERVASLDYSPWGAASGSGTTWDLVLGLAGIKNAVGNLEVGDFGQVALSKELVLSIDPDILFLPGHIWGEDDGAENFKKQVLEDSSLAGLKAIETGRVYVFPERLKGAYSQFLIDAAEEAARLAYPNKFKVP